MLDFYEGELLRRTVLVRNALRRAASEGTANDAQQFFGGIAPPSAETAKDIVNDEEDDISTTDVVAHVQVSDYDYGTYEDDEEEQTVSVAVGEHVWFDDLFDEVSIEQGGVSRKHTTGNVINNNTTLSVHPADRDEDESGAHTCPSLIDDEGSSTDESDDDEADKLPSILLRTATSKRPTTKVAIDFDGGAPLARSTSRKSKSIQKKPSSYHDRIHNSRHSLSTSRPSVISY